MILRLLLIVLLSVSTPVFAQGSPKESDQLDFAQGLLSRGMYDMAIMQYQKFISDYPQSTSMAQAYLALGEGYFLSKEFDQALDTFKKFKQLYPNSDQLPVSSLRLGQIEIQMRKYDDALQELTSIDTQKQLKGELLQSFEYYTALAYLGKQDLPHAFDLFQKAAQVQGANAYTAYAYKEMGMIDSNQGHYDSAMTDYTKALQAANEDALKGEITYRIAELDFLASKFTDAVKAFQQVIDHYPNIGFTQDALANMLLAYFNLDQFDQLLAAYQKNAKLLQDKNDHFNVHFAAAQANIELKRFPEANILLDRMLGLQTISPQERARIFVKKADILIRQKKFVDAMAILNAYSSVDTDDADETDFLKAQAFFGLADFDHAFNFYENVSLNFPSSRFASAAILGQAHARQEMGRFKESEVLFLKYEETQNDPVLKAEALYDAVMTAAKAQETTNVISNAGIYLKDYPNGDHDDDVVIVLADSLGKNGQTKDAVDLLKGYLSRPALTRPNSANFLLGFEEEVLGDGKDALNAYNQVDQKKEEGKFYWQAVKNMAILDLTLGNTSQAKSNFDLLISQPGPNDLQIKTYIWVCNEYLKQQKYSDVLRIAGIAEKQFASQSLREIKYFEAEAWRGSGQCDQAQAVYAQIISLPAIDAFSGSSHIGYGLCLENDKKYDDAKAQFQKTLDENADDYTITAHARFETANLDVSKGDLDEALKYYVLISTIYEDSYYCSQSLLKAGKILEQMGRKQDALKMYSELLDKYPDSDAAADAKERSGALK